MSARARFPTRAFLFASAASLALTSCTMGAPIASAGSPITATEAQQGAEANPQLIAEFGGAMSGPQADYVVSVGKNIAVQSGLAGARDDFTVTLLNSWVVKAHRDRWAIPRSTTPSRSPGVTSTSPASWSG